MNAQQDDNSKTRTSAGSEAFCVRRITKEIVDFFNYPLRTVKKQTWRFDEEVAASSKSKEVSFGHRAAIIALLTRASLSWDKDIRKATFVVRRQVFIDKGPRNSQRVN